MVLKSLLLVTILVFLFSVCQTAKEQSATEVQNQKFESDKLASEWIESEKLLCFLQKQGEIMCFSVSGTLPSGKLFVGVLFF